MNKNVVKIIFFGLISLIVIILAFFMYNKKKEMNNDGWRTYKNDEFNIETRMPEGVEIEIKN